MNHQNPNIAALLQTETINPEFQQTNKQTNDLGSPDDEQKQVDPERRVKVQVGCQNPNNSKSSGFLIGEHSYTDRRSSNNEKRILKIGQKEVY